MLFAVEVAKKRCLQPPHPPAQSCEPDRRTLLVLTPSHIFALRLCVCAVRHCLFVCLQLLFHGVSELTFDA